MCLVSWPWACQISRPDTVLSVIVREYYCFFFLWLWGRAVYFFTIGFQITRLGNTTAGNRHYNNDYYNQSHYVVNNIAFEPLKTTRIQSIRQRYTLYCKRAVVRLLQKRFRYLLIYYFIFLHALYFVFEHWTFVFESLSISEFNTCYLLEILLYIKRVSLWLRSKQKYYTFNAF